MRFGCFGFIRHIPLIEQAGFDTAELDICEINALPDDAFKRLLEKADATTLSFEVFSGLIPLTERFHSEDFSRRLSPAGFQDRTFPYRGSPHGYGGLRVHKGRIPKHV